ncbi:RWD domain-containing protein 2B, variant 2 [Basidiobolus ranarum]
MKEIAWLFVILPTHYPTVSPQIHISTSKLSREVQAITNEVISEYLKAHIGESCIHEVYELVREKIQQLNNEGSIFHENPDNVKEEITSIKKERPKIGRALLWMHHIKNPNKRKDIVHWADELQLNGFSKPGYPGIVVVEGLDENVQEYISRLKVSIELFGEHCKFITFYVGSISNILVGIAMASDCSSSQGV